MDTMGLHCEALWCTLCEEEATGGDVTEVRIGGGEVLYDVGRALRRCLTGRE